MKLKEKHHAIQLRHKGRTLNEISKAVGVSKSSISLWVRNIQLSQKAQGRIARLQTAGQRAAQQAHLEQTKKNLLAAKAEAEATLQKINMTPELALLLCSLLYWCEGAKDKNDKTFTFSNSDPQLVHAFMQLIRHSTLLDEHKFRLRMHLHAYHDESAQRSFWSKVTGIPEQQFARTYWKPHTAKTIKDGYPGCIHIGYYDVKVARKIYAMARAFIKNCDTLAP